MGVSGREDVDLGGTKAAGAGTFPADAVGMCLIVESGCTTHFDTPTSPGHYLPAAWLQ